MRMIPFALVIFTTFLSCTPRSIACKTPEKSTTPWFWLYAPDDRPGAFFSRREWKAEEQFSRSSVRTLKQYDKHAASPPLPVGMSNTFTACLFHGQDPEGNDPLILPQGENQRVPNEEVKPRQGPSIFSTTISGVILFAIGMVGWIALGVSVLLLEQRETAK